VFVVKVESESENSRKLRSNENSRCLWHPFWCRWWSQLCTTAGK